LLKIQLKVVKVLLHIFVKYLALFGSQWPMAWLFAPSCRIHKFDPFYWIFTAWR